MTPISYLQNHYKTTKANPFFLHTDPSVTGLVETTGAHFQQDVSTSVTVDIDVENMASGMHDDISSATGGDSNFDFEPTFSDKNLETDSS